MLHTLYIILHVLAVLCCAVVVSGCSGSDGWTREMPSSILHPQVYMTVSACTRLSFIYMYVYLHTLYLHVHVHVTFLHACTCTYVCVCVCTCTCKCIYTSLTIRGDRYDALRICIGQDIIQKLADLKLFMVSKHVHVHVTYNLYMYIRMHMFCMYYTCIYLYIYTVQECVCVLMLCCVVLCGGVGWLWSYWV